MQSASDARPSDPRRAEAAGILQSCIHCGLCMTACPTYRLTLDEREGPRGRIDLVRHMFAEGGQPDREVRRHLDSCVPCWSCMSSCPANVDIRHLFDLARTHIRETHRRPLKERVARDALAEIAGSADHGGPVTWTARAVRPLRAALARLGWKELASLFTLAPAAAAAARPGVSAKAGVLKPRGERKGRVALFLGCTQQALRPQVNEAAIHLLTRHGIEVVLPAGQGCCGAIDLTLGNEAKARTLARDNVDVWTRTMRDGSLDAIVTATPTCAVRLKEYGRLLKRDQGYAGRAERVGGLVRDIVEVLYPIDLVPPRHWSGLKVACHASCAAHHGLGIGSRPATLLRRIGYTVTEHGGSGVCCGAAGAYNILQPEASAALSERTMAGIQSAAPDVIVTSDLGCLTQLAAATAIPVVHVVELIDWTLGGPCPKELESVSECVHKIGRSSAPKSTQPHETETTDVKRRWRRRIRSG